MKTTHQEAARADITATPTVHAVRPLLVSWPDERIANLQAQVEILQDLATRAQHREIALANRCEMLETLLKSIHVLSREQP